MRNGKTLDIKLDVSQPNNIKIFEKESNSENFLSVVLTNSGETITLESNVNAVFSVLDDGKTKVYECTIESNGAIVVPLDYWNGKDKAINKCDIWIIDNDTHVLHNAHFYLYFTTPLKDDKMPQMMINADGHLIAIYD